MKHNVGGSKAMASWPGFGLRDRQARPKAKAGQNFGLALALSLQYGHTPIETQDIPAGYYPTTLHSKRILRCRILGCTRPMGTLDIHVATSRCEWIPQRQVWKNFTCGLQQK
ncbi:hypothetical protein DFH07DRAFT_764027 [Mycena maculata]|uniref:Uncharacterized protein n=1 Tax=Mycena maculata TaxID=230809 RepID=A0AAD7P1A8_9AGAR|nr:hypothetical protein DFH07DRAFT_764027 [Mycena maculata]